MPEINARIDRPLLGVSMRLLAVMFMATMFMLVKYLGERDVHLVEMVFYRFLFAALFIGAWVVFKSGLSSVKTENIRGHAQRAFFGMCGMCLNFLGVMMLPLPEAATVGFTVPFIATVLSVLILSEYVGVRRWLAVCIGFIGIIIALQPGQSDIPLAGALVAFAGAIVTAYVIIIVRRLSFTESSQTIVFYFSVMALPVFAVAMIWFGKMHSLEVFGLLALMGLFGLFGQLALSESLRHANVAVIMPVDYCKLIFASFYGYFIWDYVPQASLWFGLPLIIGSGLYIALRERKLGKKSPVARRAGL